MTVCPLLIAGWPSACIGESRRLRTSGGPKHPFLLGMMVDLVCRRDPHRYATELAEQYGPIFKFRLLIFHVSASRLSLEISQSIGGRPAL